MAITIPDPVITTSVWTGRGEERWSREFNVDIEVGHVVVMSRMYRSDDDGGHYGEPGYADDEQEALAQALTEFGEKIRNLIGEQ